MLLELDRISPKIFNKMEMLSNENRRILYFLENIVYDVLLVSNAIDQELCQNIVQKINDENYINNKIVEYVYPIREASAINSIMSSYDKISADLDFNMRKTAKENNSKIVLFYVGKESETLRINAFFYKK